MGSRIQSSTKTSLHPPLLHCTSIGALHPLQSKHTTPLHFNRCTAPNTKQPRYSTAFHCTASTTLHHTPQHSLHCSHNNATPQLRSFHCTASTAFHPPSSLHSTHTTSMYCTTYCISLHCVVVNNHFSSTASHYALLHGAVLYIALHHHFTLHFTSVHFTARCSTRHCTVFHCISLAALHYMEQCSTLQYISLYGVVIYTALYFTTHHLNFTARCNTLHDTVPPNTVLHCTALSSQGRNTNAPALLS